MGYGADYDRERATAARQLLRSVGAAALVAIMIVVLIDLASNGVIHKDNQTDWFWFIAPVAMILPLIEMVAAFSRPMRHYALAREARIEDAPEFATARVIDRDRS